MRVSNDAIATNQSMGVSFVTDEIPTEHIGVVDIRAYWTGNPVGDLKLQSSADDPEAGISNWDDYPNSTHSVTGSAGKIRWIVGIVSETRLRVSYTRTSGSGTINIRFNAKGF
jgi:hypothetical protein